MAEKEIINNIEGEYKYGFTSDIETDAIGKGLNEEVIRIISAKKEEPEWMLERRLAAFPKNEGRSFFEDFGVKTKERPKRENGKRRAREKRSRRAQRRKRCKKRLLADAEAFDERDVTRLIFAFQIVEKAAAIANHLKETATGRVVLFVDLHVFGQRVDFLRQQRDLDFRGPDVGIAAAVFGDDRLFFFFGHDRHSIHLFVWEID